jgi:hypothetical protein
MENNSEENSKTNVQKDAENPKAKGGYARAEALSPEERSEIARKAAMARWSSNLPRATHEGILHIGSIAIPCAVLEDGTRCLSEHGITKALLGWRSGASKRLKRASREQGGLTPVFLAPGNLKPFISDELVNGPLKPIVYHAGNHTVTGFAADVLPAACDVWLRARDAGALQGQQLDKARKAEILMRGLAHVGVIALVDEATGYQEVRDRLALQAILDKFLAKEFAAWAKRFPDEFYQQIFRLRSWQWRGMKVNRPQVVANYTKDLVYARLAPGILRELESRNPKNERGIRKAKHHQWLTEDIGHPALAQHLHAVTGLMRASESWVQFKRMLDRAFPKRGETLNFPFMNQEPSQST